MLDTFSEFPVESCPTESPSVLMAIEEIYNHGSYVPLEQIMCQFTELGIAENVTAIQGDVCETLMQPHRIESICILRVDCDLFEPVLAALEGLYHLVQPGGWVIVDDYHNTSMNCRKAVDGFISDRGLDIQLQQPIDIKANDYVYWKVPKQSIDQK